MNIYLIGLTGTGKSKVGKMLANKLSYSFIDLDEVIQFENNRTIEEIFEKDGEDYFRKLENKFLKQIPKVERCIVATGGGTPCFLDSMDYIKAEGLSIFLYTPVSLIVERLFQSDYSQRPMLKGKTKEELKHFLSQKLEDRLPFYSRADFSIDTQIAESPEKLASMLFVLVRIMEQEKMNKLFKNNQ